MTNTASDQASDQELRDYLEEATRSSRHRPVFDAPRSDEIPQAVQLAEGPALPPIVGIPSTVALCGPHQYLEFAKVLRDVRGLTALSVPGFVAGQRLPATLSVAVELQATAVQRLIGDGRPVLAGYSSGGTFAYGMAAHLEAVGLPVAAVVLIDAYPFATVSNPASPIPALLRKMFEDPALRMYLNGTRLTAMAWYTKLFMGWDLKEIAAPTLLLRPTEPMPGTPPESEWRASWPLPHDAIEVPGNHWTMMLEHADATATAVDRWLSATTPNMRAC